jgi:hypothetical protein
MAQGTFASAQQRQGYGKQQAPQYAVEDGMDCDGHFFLESSINCFNFSAFFAEIFLVKQMAEEIGRKLFPVLRAGASCFEQK